MKWLRGKNQYDVLIIKPLDITRYHWFSLIPTFGHCLVITLVAIPVTVYLHVARVWFHISLLCNDIITPPVSRLTPCSAPRDQRSVTESLYPSQHQATSRALPGELGQCPGSAQWPAAPSLAQSLSRHNKPLLLLVFWAPRHYSPLPLTAEDLSQVSQVGWYATGSGSF